MTGPQGGPTGRPELTEDDRAQATAAGLSEDEAVSAKSTGTTFARYAALRDVRNIAEWERMRQAERQQVALDRDRAQHQNLKQAILEALAERDKASTDG